MSLRRVDRAVADYVALRPRLLPATEEFVALVGATLSSAIDNAYRHSTELGEYRKFDRFGGLVVHRGIHTRTSESSLSTSSGLAM